MATYFCDTGLTTGDNNGTTMDHAYRTIKAAMERASYGTGDILWIRRRSTESPTADITPAATSDATVASPIRFIGWPRTTKAITSSDWTNGSTSVTVDDADMSRGHLGRYITAPSGKKYLITRVVDASTIIIDREYSGSTVTNQAATIHADEDYTEAQAIDDSAWTIKKADWNADAHTLPVIDFGTGVFNVNIAGNGPFVLSNIDFKDSADTAGTISFTSTPTMQFTGCLFSQSNNAPCVTCASGAASFRVDRCVFAGSSSGASQVLMSLARMIALVTNSALYGAGDFGLALLNGVYTFDNVNIGVEIGNGDDDISFATNCNIYGKDLLLGGTVGLVQITGSTVGLSDIGIIMIENYAKILGANRILTNTLSTITRYPVVAGSGDPYKRTGGADDVIQVALKGANDARPTGMEVQAAEWRFWADTTSKSYRVYCQQVAMPTLTAAQAFLEATYVDEYDDTSEYHTTKVVSDESITVRSGADDWGQYLEVTGIQPAVAGWVTIRLMVQWYDADGYLYVDPLVVVS